MNDKKLDLTGGDNSQNQQALKIKNIYKNYGPTEAQLLESQVEVFRRNMPVLAQTAAEIMMERAWEFFERLVTEKLHHDPKLLEAFADPGMQWAALEAQKQYARTGDKDVFEILIDLLSERASQKKRNLLQIVLDESLTIVPKLTEEHLDCMTLLFILQHIDANIEHSYNGLSLFIDTYLRPFINNLVANSSCLSHLQYSNCVSFTSHDESGRRISTGSQFVGLLVKKYPIFFMKGFSIAEFEAECGKMSHFPDELFIPSIFDASCIQFNYINLESFYAFARKIDTGYSDNYVRLDDRRQLLLKYQEKKKFVRDEAVQFLMEKWPFLEIFISEEISKNYKPSQLLLTSVGLALSQANFKRKTGISIKLSDWIN